MPFEVAGSSFIFMFILDLTISQKMAEKWNQITHILEREDKEFTEAMREQIGTIFPNTNALKNIGSFKMLTDTGIITQCGTKSQNLGYACP